MVVFFDGVCNLCQSSVKYLIKFDSKQQLKFASLQGLYAKKILPQEDLIDLDSIVFYDGKVFYQKSDAFLKLCGIIGRWHNIFLLGYLLPKFLRNGLYDLIAKNRYRWFGKQDYCMVPTKDIQDRFLE